MRVDPVIAALRGDPAPQRRAQAAMVIACDAWRAEPGIAPVLADFERYGGGAALGDCPDLARLFAPGEAAGHFADAFCRRFGEAIASQPFGQLPFRHSFDGALATLLLARAGTAQLTLVAREPGRYQTTSATFSDAERHDAIVAGAARARATRRLRDGTFIQREVGLATGLRLELDLSREALFVTDVERRLVTLRLHRAAPRPAPAREYALADGALIRQAAGAIRDSRYEVMLALLGRMKRHDAAPLMAEIVSEERADSLRWEALREAFALDTAVGFAAPCRVARSPLDSLAAPAGALRAQLIEAHPQLRAFEENQCRA